MFKDSNKSFRIFPWLIGTELCWWTLTFFVLWTLSSELIPGLLLTQPEALFLLFILPFISVVFWKNMKQKERIQTAFSKSVLTGMVNTHFSAKQSFIRYSLFRLTLLLVIFSASQPIFGKEKVKGNKQIVDLVVCLDISNSMNTKDMNEGKTTRLSAAKQGLQELINRLSGQRIGVVVFANEAFTQIPLTMDYAALKLLIPDIESDLISNQGTNIGSALAVAQKQFKDTDAGASILVITDGENHQNRWKTEHLALKQKNISVMYYGMGSESGGLIPNDPFDSSQGFKRENGKAIVSRLDIPGIQKMAASTSSRVVFSDSEFPNMTPVLDYIQQIKTRSEKKTTLIVSKNHFQFLLIGAILAFLTYLFLPFLVQKQRL